MNRESGANTNAADFVKGTRVYKLTVNDDRNEWYIEFTSQAEQNRIGWQKGFGGNGRSGHLEYRKENQ